MRQCFNGRIILLADRPQIDHNRPKKPADSPQMAMGQKENPRGPQFWETFFRLPNRGFLGYPVLLTHSQIDPWKECFESFNAARKTPMESDAGVVGFEAHEDTKETTKNKEVDKNTLNN